MLIQTRGGEVEPAKKVSAPAILPEVWAGKIMRGILKKTGGGKFLLAVVLGLAIAGCATTPSSPQPVQHIVLMWLVHPGSAADRAQLLRAARSLQMVPGVLRVETGRGVPLPNAEADRDFDLGVAITFRDRAALQRYERDPRRADAMQRYLRPLVRRYIIYNLNTR